MNIETKKSIIYCLKFRIENIKTNIKILNNMIDIEQDNDKRFGYRCRRSAFEDLLEDLLKDFDNITRFLN